MKITREAFKNIVKETMIEESEYQEFFKRALEKTGKSIPDMSDEEKKAFFNKIDAAWQGKGEKNEELVGNQAKLDVDGDGEIEASDLAALRAGKKVDEAANLKTIAMLFQNKGIKDAVRKDHADKLRKIIEDSGVSTKGVSDSELIKVVKQLTSESVEEASTSSAPGEWVAYLSMTRGKKLLKTFNTARGAKQFLSKNVDKLLGGSNVESVGIMTKKQWDEREAKYAIEGVNEASSKEKEIYAKIEKLRVLSNSGKITGDEFLDKFMPLWKQLKGMKSESVVNEASKPTIKIVTKLKNEQGIQIVVVKTTKGETEYGGFVVRGKLQKVIPVGANKTKEDVKKRALQIWDEFGKQLGESESVSEGKKRFKQQDGVGSSKYTISYHDGRKKHKDGSDFFDIKIFKNKPELEAFKKDLVSKGFVSESVNEAGGTVKNPKTGKDIKISTALSYGKSHPAYKAAAAASQQARPAGGAPGVKPKPPVNAKPAMGTKVTSPAPTNAKPAMGTKVTSAPPRNAQPPVGTKVTGPPPGVRPKPPVVAPPPSGKPSVGTPPGVRPKPPVIKPSAAPTGGGKPPLGPPPGVKAKPPVIAPPSAKPAGTPPGVRPKPPVIAPPSATKAPLGPPPGVRPKGAVPPPPPPPPPSGKPAGTPPGVRPKGAVPPPPPPPPPPIPPKKSKFEDKESVTEAGTPIDFKWPKGNTSKEIEKLEAEYKKLIEKGSDILEKQKQLIRKEPLTGEYPWENYDKWPTKLKIEVAKLEKEFEKNHAITTEMGKKLFKLKGFNR